GLGLFEEAAQTYGRLSRFAPERRRRAQALYRQGRILLESLGDETRSFEIFLKSSDLDPTFEPTAMRLVDGFWRRGQFEDVADVASELGTSEELVHEPLLARLQIAMACLLARRDLTRVLGPVSVLGDVVEQPEAAAAVLGAAAAATDAAQP